MATGEKKARELAFHYGVFADHYLNPADLSSFGSSGLAEIAFYATNDLHSIPGNDLIISLQGLRDPRALAVPLSAPAATIPCPKGFLQGQTLVHELGHTLGLRHGGNDNLTSPPPGNANYVAAVYNAKQGYTSLMSYAYQLSPGTNGALVRDYSRVGDAVFDNWDELRMDFTSYPFFLGNSFGNNFASGGNGTNSNVQPEQNLQDLQLLHGAFDGEPPSITILTPTPGTAIALGSTLTVQLLATDNVAVDHVTVVFDKNGDGTNAVPGERVTAALTGVNSYTASFSGLSGPAGLRSLLAYAIDTSEFVGSTTGAVLVTSSGCGFQLDHSGKSFSALGGSDLISLSASNTCAWTTFNTNGWISLTGSTAGTGSGQVSYMVIANTNAGSRSGTLFVADQSFIVTQAGTAGEPPKLGGIALSGGSLTFGWTAVVGQKFQVQFNSDLANTNWTNLGGTVTATNSVLSVSDPLGGGSTRRFYRVLLVP